MLGFCGGAQAGLPQIAVLDFSGDESISKQQLTFIAGELASELIGTQAFVVLERGRMDAILQEQGFQQSGACNSSECQVQVGQLLGVDNLVAGSLVRFGPKYAFRIEYLDVGTGRILKTISFEKTGELHDVYRAATREAAQALARFVRGEAEPPPAAVAVVPPPVLPPPVVVESPKMSTGISESTPQNGRAWKLPVVLGLAAGGLACGLLGYLADGELGEERDAYDALQNTTVAEADAQWSKVENAESKRNLFYGLGAGLLAAGITVQLFF